MQPFGPDNLMTGGLPGKPTEREVYDEIMRGERCAEDILIDAGLDDYHCRRILSAVGGDEMADAWQRQANWDRLNALADDPEYRSRDKYRKDGDIRLVASWTEGKPQGNVLASDNSRGLVLLEMTDGTRKVFEACNLQQYGADPAKLSEEKRNRDRAASLFQWATQLENAGSPRDVPKVVELRREAQRHVELADKAHQESFDWCLGSPADQEHARAAYAARGVWHP